MRFFIDTNALIDLFDEDRSFNQHVLKLFDQARLGHVELVLTSISVVNALYVLRKKMPPKHLNMYLARLFNFALLAPVERDALVAALTSGWSDTEDAIQFEAALEFGGIDVIVSNDKDFAAQKRIPVLDPAKALKLLA